MRKLFFLLIFITYLVSGNSSAFDNETTHPRLSDVSIISSSINEYVINNLNMPDGIGNVRGR